MTNKYVLSENFLKEILKEFKADHIEHNLRNIVALKEVEAAYKKTGDVVFKALNSLSKEDKWSVNQLERKLEIEEKIKAEKQNSNTFEILVPITHKLKKRKIVFLGKQFDYLSSNSVKTKFGKSEFRFWNDNHPLSTTVNSRHNYLSFTENGKDLANAFNKRYPVLEALQGFINYCLSAERFSLQLPYKHQEAEFSIRSTIYGIDKNSEMMYAELQKLHRGITAVSQTKELEPVAYTNLNFFLRKLKLIPNPNSIEELLFSVFRLYYSACNSMSKQDVFLYFWQLCESITLSQQTRGDTNTIIQRLQIFLKPKGLIDNQISNTLNNLRELRNNIVHKGIDKTDQEHILILKYYADKAIRWLLHHKNDIPTTKHLEAYYKYYSAPTTTLVSSNETINQIIKLRHKK